MGGDKIWLKDSLMSIKEITNNYIGLSGGDVTEGEFAMFPKELSVFYFALNVFIERIEKHSEVLFKNAQMHLYK
jgi:hypothetical protein